MEQKENQFALVLKSTYQKGTEEQDLTLLEIMQELTEQLKKIVGDK
ncbi:hypothetical protein [Cytobacillus oceanisediminis]